MEKEEVLYILARYVPEKKNAGRMMQGQSHQTGNSVWSLHHKSFVPSLALSLPPFLPSATSILFTNPESQKNLPLGSHDYGLLSGI